MNQKILPHEIIFILLVAALSWFPVVNASFLNDDYQILGNEIPPSITEVASPFFQTNVWGHYWRPLVEFLMKLILFIDGYNPLMFRAVTLLFFSAMVLLVVFTAKQLGMRKSGAILCGVIFAILPSRELHAAWIADWGDSLSLCFILLMTMSYLKFRNENALQNKYLAKSSLYFLLGILSKEIAFAAILIPLASEYLFNEKKFINAYVKKSMFTFAAILAVVLIYRIAVINSNPFSSPHIAEFSPLTLFRNIILYIATIFISPDGLEILYHTIQSSYIYLSICILFSVAIGLLLFVLIKNHFKRRKNLYYFLLIWFAIFLIPVLPTYMRWYSLVASFGIITSLAAFLNEEYIMTANKKYFQIIAVVIFALLIYMNLNTSRRWNDAGAKMDRIMVNIFQNRDKVSESEITLWGTPDKYLRIPLMKLGINESFAFALKRDDVVVHAPLRSEIFHPKFEIDFIPKNSTTFVLVMKGGRFLQQGGRSRAVAIDEEITFAEKKYKCKIKTTVDKNINEVFSFAEVELINGSEKLNLYFDGKDFRRIKSFSISSSASE